MPKGAVFTIGDLTQIIAKRAKDKAADSYTAMLIKKGPVPICKKVQEEVLEAAIETTSGNRDRIVNEICDVVYHILVLAEYYGISLRDIEVCLGGRSGHGVAGGEAGRDLARRLAKFRVGTACPSSKALFAASGMQRSDAADVVLFSHVLAKANAGRRRPANVFYAPAKELRTRLQGDGLKAKLAVPPDSEERFVARRSLENVIPLLYVANVVVLPICLNVLAAYVKDAFDRLSKRKDSKVRNMKVEVLLGVAPSEGRKERWYTFEGSLRDVLQQIKSLGEEGK